MPAEVVAARPGASWARAASSATLHRRRGPHLLERVVELHDPRPVGLRDRRRDAVQPRRSPPRGRTGRRPARRTPRRPARRAAGRWSQRERSTSSRVSATPSSSTRPGRRASPSRTTARSPRTSVSSGKSATSASAIDSAWRADVGEGVGRLEPGAVRDGEHAGHAVEHDREPRRALGRRPGTRNSPRACASARLARVSRAAAALSWMPRCIAVWAMVSPQTTRSASTIRAPGASASSQATKSRASRSSSSSGSVVGWSVCRPSLLRSPAPARSARRRPRRRWSSIQARLATLTHQAARSSTSSWVHGSGDRLGGVLLGVVEAARPRRQSTYDAWPGGPELLVGRPHDPMVAARRTRPDHPAIGKTLRHSMVPPVGHQGGDLAGHRLVLDLDGVEAGDQLAGVGVGAVGVDGVLDLAVTLAGGDDAAVLGALQGVAADDAGAELRDGDLEGLVLAERRRLRRGRRARHRAGTGRSPSRSRGSGTCRCRSWPVLSPQSEWRGDCRHITVTNRAGRNRQCRMTSLRSVGEQLGDQRRRASSVRALLAGRDDLEGRGDEVAAPRARRLQQGGAVGGAELDDDDGLAGCRSGTARPGRHRRRWARRGPRRAARGRRSRSRVPDRASRFIVTA